MCRGNRKSSHIFVDDIAHPVYIICMLYVIHANTVDRKQDKIR